MIYSKNPKIQATIEKLLALGCPPLPVAPYQDPRKDWCHARHFVEVLVKKPEDEIQGNYCRISTTKVDDVPAPVKGDFCRLTDKLEPVVRFTGKNPSYITASGQVKSLNHHIYQNRMPTDAEMKMWFANPTNGVGTLGEHAGINWTDFDAKNYASQEDCDRDVERIRSNVGPTWVEQTGSGGYRIALRPEITPNFTNFATDTETEKHVGEALGAGRFTVLAPTVHPNGNPYRVIEEAPIASVESLQAIGIFPSKDAKITLEKAVKRSSDHTRSNPTSPEENPWDIRNLAEYLEGNYEVNGWIKCKCPVHNGTSDNSLSINADTGAFHCFAGCDTKAIYHTAKETAIASGYAPVIDEDSRNEDDYWVPVIYDKKFPKHTSGCHQYVAEFDIPKFVAIKSEKATGKTYVIKQELVQEVIAKTKETIIMMSNRISVTKKLQADFDAESYLDNPTYKVGGRYVTTIHSLWKIPEHIRLGAKIIIDEAESTLYDLALSGNLTDNRAVVRRVIEETLANASSILCLDADLSPGSFNYLKTIRPEMELIINSYRPVAAKGEDGKGIKLNYIESKSRQAVIEEAVRLAHLYNHPYIACNRVSDAEMIKERLPNFDLVTGATKSNFPQIFEDANNYRPEGLIATPCLSTGISFEHNHFDVKILIYDGTHTTAEDAFQLMVRERGDAPCFVFGFANNAPNAYKTEDEAMQALTDRYRQECPYFSDEPTITPFTRLVAYHTAKESRQKAYPRRALLDKAFDEGYDVSFTTLLDEAVEGDTSVNDFLANLKQVKQEAVINAEDYSAEEASEVMDSSETTPEQQAAIKKYAVKCLTHSEEVDAEAVEFYDKKRRTVKVREWLEDEEMARDVDCWQEHRYAADKDFAVKTREMLLELGVDKMLKNATNITQEDLEVLGAAARKEWRRVRATLGIDCRTPNKNTIVARNILKCVGLEGKSKVVSLAGEKIRIMSIQLDPYLEAVIQRRKDAREEKVKQDSEETAVPEVAKYISKKAKSGTAGRGFASQFTKSNLNVDDYFPDRSGTKLEDTTNVIVDF